MKKVLLFTSILFILFGCAKSDSEAEKAKAEAVVKGFYKAAESFDYETMRSLCTMDFHAIENGHVFNNLDEFFEMFKFLEGSKGQVKMDFVQTDVARDIASLIVKFDAEWIKEPSQWFMKTIENYVLKKVNGKWLINFFQSTYLADEHDKKHKSIHFMKIPDNLPISDLNELILTLNNTIAALGYQDCGYTLLKVISENDSRFTWVLEGNWKNPDVYKIIHENEEFNKLIEQSNDKLKEYIKDQIYLKVELP